MNIIIDILTTFMTWCCKRKSVLRVPLRQCISVL
jgi:hypothetical protein